MILIATVITALISVCLANHLRHQLGASIAWVLVPIIICAIFIYLHKRSRIDKAQQFNKVRDLVQGSVEANVDGLKEAYEHFKGMKTVEVISVKQEL
jgi:apolipoprotein N-acyltransferase